MESIMAYFITIWLRKEDDDARIEEYKQSITQIAEKYCGKLQEPLRVSEQKNRITITPNCNFQECPQLKSTIDKITTEIQKTINRTAKGITHCS